MFLNAFNLTFLDLSISKYNVHSDKYTHYNNYNLLVVIDSNNNNGLLTFTYLVFK